MSKLDDILSDLAKVASGLIVTNANQHIEAKQQIKALFLDLIGTPEHLGDTNPMDGHKRRRVSSLPRLPN